MWMAQTNSFTSNKVAQNFYCWLCLTTAIIFNCWQCHDLGQTQIRMNKLDVIFDIDFIFARLFNQSKSINSNQKWNIIKMMSESFFSSRQISLDCFCHKYSDLSLESVMKVVFSKDHIRSGVHWKLLLIHLVKMRACCARLLFNGLGTFFCRLPFV